MKKENNFVRVNFNISKELLEKVDDIGNMKGFNRTQMLLVCINNYIDQLETMNYMPKVIEIIKAEQRKELEELANKKK
jgi:metal-responsive CopG/Arc/MetJ family transcriptional regulator